MKYVRTTSKQCPNCITRTSRYLISILSVFRSSYFLFDCVPVFLQSYSTRLLKLVDSNGVNKEDVLGAEDSSLGAAAAPAARSLFGRAAPAARGSSSKSTVFTLGTRMEVLNNLEAPVLVPHVAAVGTSTGHRGETRYSYEGGFRSQQYALTDNACREYLFLCEFFLVESVPAKELFNEVMGRTCTTYIVIKRLELNSD